MKRKGADLPSLGKIKNIVTVSDTHFGDALALCPEGFDLDDGGIYQPGRLQRVMWAWWEEFWDEFVPKATRGEPYVVVHNGDIIDGSHHGSTNQITHNIESQRRMAEEALRPRLNKAVAFYATRGTEAHVGASSEDDNSVARALGAVPDSEKRRARYELSLDMGGHLINFMHHISTSTSPFARTGALQREVTNHYVEVGKWGDKPYSMLVRSHRHTHDEVTHRSNRGKVTVTTTPAWQLKTPFVYRIAARMAQPEIGGLVIRLADDELFTRPFVKRIEPPKEERI